eukprot:15455302-Alexandrium_andersonii.AAC.1
MGQPALSAAPKLRKSETPAPAALHMNLRNGGLRLSPIRSRGEGRLARWARCDRRPLGLDFGARAHFGQPIK